MSHHRTPSILFTAAGGCLAAYPALRPWTDAATDIGSTQWVAAHALGMLGLALLALALRELRDLAPSWWAGQPIRRAETRMWLALALLLPYYGAETFALHEVARQAPGALGSALSFRTAGLPTATFGAALLLLALVGSRLMIGLWHAARIGAVLAGTGLLTYLPQFFTPMPVRILHGVVLGLGLVLCAQAMSTRTARVPAPVVSAPSNLAI